MDLQSNTRIVWIDTMKVFCMYFVILGHFFPRGYVYIYLFNVPVFFIISGFLCKKEESHILFWKKIAQNYIIPLLFICMAMFIWNWFSWEQNEKSIRSLYFLYYAFIGSQKCLGTGWFIYTLIIIRVISHYSPSTTMSNLSLFCLFSIISIILQHHNVHYSNAITNVAIAYPLFLIGHYFSKYKTIINNFHDIKILYALPFITTIIIYICGKINGEVWVFNNDYGRSYLLFLVGSVNGTILLYSFSITMKERFAKFIHILSIGNIITLGFHPIIITSIGPQKGFIVYIISFIILISFYPITVFSIKHFPYILGANTNKKNELKIY